MHGPVSSSQDQQIDTSSGQLPNRLMYFHCRGRLKISAVRDGIQYLSDCLPVLFDATACGIAKDTGDEWFRKYCRYTLELR